MVGTVALGLLLPFAGTTLGAGAVFFLKREIGSKVQKMLLGFASGVMIAASVWSLILPSAELAKEAGMPEWLPPAVGFAAGMLFLLLLDSVVPHQHLDSELPEGHKSSLGKNKLLFLSVTLHNIPEGMAVGAVFAGLIAAGEEISVASALSLSVGIALQNFPEGAIVSMPMKGQGRRGKAFLYGFLSGAVEPVAALVTVAFSGIILPVLPYLLSFAAGAMVYVVVEELIPESQSGEHSNIATVGVMLGFVVMMILDMALG
ncbi:MAG TPA: ZIP family metal transporter [Candidatus Scatosoma pullicola]|nr:ZIP family metal transporter [Candidatus Scatosoma pullicola]